MDVTSGVAKLHGTPSIRGRGPILLTTSIGSFLTPFLSSAAAFAVPSIGRYFHLSFIQAAIIPMVLLIPLASMMIFLGKFADAVGRVLIFRMGFMVFMAFSLVAAFSRSYTMLLASLFMVGFGSAALSTNGTAIVSYIFSRGGRGFALGINAMAVYLGLTFAPFLGGTLIEAYDWQSVFYFSAGMAVVGYAVSMFSLRSIDMRGRRSREIPQAGLFMASLLSITSFAALGYFFGYLRLIYLIVIGLILLGIFVYREIRSDVQVIPRQMVSGNRTFVASNITALLNYLSTFSIVFVFSIYLQAILRITPFISGLIILPEPVMMVLLSPVAGRLSDRYGSRVIASLGMIIIGASFIYLFVYAGRDIRVIMASLAVIGVGFGLFSAPNTNSVMSSIDPMFSGIGSGFLGTMRFLGQLFSIIMASSILSSYIPRELVSGIFSGAVVSIDPAYAADFVHGFRIVMIVSGILSLAGAYTSLLKNRGR
ncbi:MFS transporter [Thermoplasma acidophilum]|nr:MFS transporter [Thermoplasma acidophilum]